jgi:N-carbamoylputrescine amidase
MRIGFVEWPHGLEPIGPHWDEICRAVDQNKPDILITNEMPFGPWLASSPHFDTEAAARSISLHEAGIAALARLGVSTILSSRPVWLGNKLANQAFVLQQGKLTPLHRKHFFPAEEGWHETEWFQNAGDNFAQQQVGGINLGVLLCTELMFNEYARAYGKSGTELIAVPRATGLSHHEWRTAAAMAAIVSGCYVISSNRVGPSENGPTFGGNGMAFAPDGTLLAETSSATPLVVMEVDLQLARQQKKDYPCYVAGPEDI